MEIVTAWKLENGDERPWLVSSYDEITQEEHNGTPQFYLDAVESARGRFADGSLMRELVIQVPDSVLTDLFTIPATGSKVISGREL